MSIILDALKKAEGTQPNVSQADQPIGGHAAGTFVPASATGVQPKHVTLPRMPRGLNRRTLILLVVVVLAVGLFAYMRLGKGLSFLNRKTQVIEPISANDLPAAQNTIGANPASATQATINELQATASAKFAERKYDESAGAYEKLTHLLPSDPVVYNNYGVTLKKQGQIDSAVEAYQTALALSPDYAEALNNLAVAEMARRRYNEARNALEKAIALKPDYIDPHLHLGLCLERLGDAMGAVTSYEKFLELSAGEVDRSIRLQVEQRIEELKE